MSTIQLGSRTKGRWWFLYCYFFSVKKHSATSFYGTHMRIKYCRVYKNKYCFAYSYDGLFGCKTRLFLQESKLST